MSCWIWPGTVGSNGYAYYQHKAVHRLSYEHFNGPIPLGMYVCHKCDVKVCFNPGHLELGDNSKNQKDAWIRGLTLHLKVSQRKATEKSAQVRKENPLCRLGHLRDVTRKDGRKYCSSCRRERERRK